MHKPSSVEYKHCLLAGGVISNFETKTLKKYIVTLT